MSFWTWDGTDWIVSASSGNLPFHPSHLEDFDDIGEMTELNEAALLHGLKHRFFLNKTCTRLGDILISVNPYEQLQVENNVDLTTIAVEAYALMMGGPRRNSQSILVHGESGAGKTEATKKLIERLSLISRKARIEAKSANQVKVDSYFKNMGLGGSKSSSGSARSLLLSKRRRGAPIQPQMTDMSDVSSTVEQNIIDMGTILESFGNAVTGNNFNSSRFGKYLQVNYDRNGVMVGARTRHFLLEKTRVTKHDQGQQSFHIFYQLLNAINSDDDEFRYEAMPTAFNYLHPELLETSTQPESVRIAEVRDAMENIGIESDTREKLWKVLLIILQIGNIQFIRESAGGGLDGCKIDSGDLNSVSARAMVSQYLGQSEIDLEKALCFRTVKAGNRSSTFQSPMSREQAEESRDGLAQALYTAVFDYIVQVVNSRTCLFESNASASIGILDIFGFEVTQMNSFEQMCINYSNEFLQHLFDRQMLTRRHEELHEEGLDNLANMLQFRGNAEVLSAFDDKPHGILHILDEASALELSSANFLSSLGTRTYGSEIVHTPKVSGQTTFTITHRAGAIEYDASNFVSKNSDALQADVSDILLNSSNAFISSLYEMSTGSSDSALSSNTTTTSEESKPNAGGRVLSASRNNASPRMKTDRKRASQKTIGGLFRRQLQHLESVLSETRQHYIRCIKPNSKKISREWDSVLVLNQLNYLSINEVVRFKTEGFCDVISLDSLSKLLQPFTRGPRGPAQLLTIILPHNDGENRGWVAGHSKVFFKAATMTVLKSLIRHKRWYSAWLIIRRWRKCILGGYGSSAILIQRSFRRMIQRTKAATIVCFAWRSYVREQRTRRSLATMIQSRYRAFYFRSYLLKVIIAATSLQRWYRLCLILHKNQQTIVRIQCFARGFLAMKRLKRVEETSKRASSSQLLDPRGSLDYAVNEWDAVILPGETVIDFIDILVSKKEHWLLRVLTAEGESRFCVVDPDKRVIQSIIYSFASTCHVFMSNGELRILAIQEKKKKMLLKYNIVCSEEWVMRFCRVSVKLFEGNLWMSLDRARGSMCSLPTKQPMLLLRKMKKGLWDEFHVVLYESMMLWYNPSTNAFVGGCSLGVDSSIRSIPPKYKKPEKCYLYQIQLSSGCLPNDTMVLRHPSESSITEWKTALMTAAVAPRTNDFSKSRRGSISCDSAAILKDQGNVLFKEMDYVGALSKYSQAVEILSTPDTNDLLVKVLNNRAICFFKIANYHKCIVDSSTVLGMDDSNAKAMVRRGLSYEKLNQIGLACRDFEHAVRVVPDMGDAIAGIERLKKYNKDDDYFKKIKRKSGLDSCSQPTAQVNSRGDLQEKYTAMYDYESTDGGDLSLKMNEAIVILEKHADGWWKGRNEVGKVGVFPGSYVKKN